MLKILILKHVKLSIFWGRSTHTHVFACFCGVWNYSVVHTAGGVAPKPEEFNRRWIIYDDLWEIEEMHLIIYDLIGGLEHLLFSPVVGRMIQSD